MRLIVTRTFSVLALAAGLLTAVIGVAPQVAGAATAASMRALTPTRVVDTRDGTGAPMARVDAGETLTVQITGAGGVPAWGVGAVAVTITAVSPSADGWMTAWPAGTVRPKASNVNFVSGQTVANYANVKLSDSGQMSIYNSAGTVDVLVDVSGWFGTESGYVPDAPVRLVDTRNGTGAPVGRLPGGQTLTVQATGNAGIPASGVDAVAVNITVAYPSLNGWATVWPSDAPRPATSTVNFRAGQATPNFAIVKLSPSGTFSLFNYAGAAHFVVDVAGWFPVNSNYTPLTSSRVVDTRVGTGAPMAKVGPGQTLDVQVTGVGGVPAGASMAAVNITATRQTAAGWLTAYATGDPRPDVSNLNFTAGVSTSTFAIVRLSSSGKMTIFNSAGNTDVIVDVVGFLSLVELQNVVSVSRGYTHSCAVVTGNKVVCWGSSLDGELGGGAFGPSSFPVPVAGITDAVSVSSGSFESCALTTGRTVKCWGANVFGQLGDGTTTRSNIPVDVVGLSNVTQISVGNLSACARLSDGTAKCWGSNLAGLLGNDGTADSSTPVAVSGLTNVAEVSVGAYSACARLTDGTAKCWGSNEGGELGDGTNVDSSVPVAVSGVTNAKSISAGRGGCVLLQTNEVKCWGPNGLGQLGNGTTVDSNVPVLVSGITDATAVSASGGGFTCVTRTGNSAVCWGYNGHGRLGNGTTTDAHTPVAVSGLSGVVSLSSGGEGGCAVVTGQRLLCWGYGLYGQNGDGTEVDRLTPAKVFAG